MSAAERQAKFKTKMRTQGKNQITVWVDKDQETIVKNYLKSGEIHVTSNSYTIEYYKALALLQTIHFELCNRKLTKVNIANLISERLTKLMTASKITSVDIERKLLL